MDLSAANAFFDRTNLIEDFVLRAAFLEGDRGPLVPRTHPFRKDQYAADRRGSIALDKYRDERGTGGLHQGLWFQNAHRDVGVSGLAQTWLQTD